MSVHEIDHLLKNSIKFVKESAFDESLKRQMIWSLENIPEKYAFDAGNFLKTEVDSSFDYLEINPYDLGVKILVEANNGSRDINLIYDWSAFLLNFGNEYFSEIGTIETLKETYLEKMSSIFKQHDFIDYKPLHRTLTVYQDGNDWFSKEQNDLIKWYCT